MSEQEKAATSPKSPKKSNFFRLKNLDLSKNKFVFDHHNHQLRIVSYEPPNQEVVQKQPPPPPRSQSLLPTSLLGKEISMNAQMMTPSVIQQRKSLYQSMYGLIIDNQILSNPKTRRKMCLEIWTGDHDDVLTPRKLWAAFYTDILNDGQQLSRVF